jgi:luciferase-type oxidoreductase
MTGHPDQITHAGFDRVFGSGGLTLGLMFPIEAYQGAIPSMSQQTELAIAAERGGFAAVWDRDVPLLDPTFGDGGQLFDPWVWLTHIGAATERIALGTASVVLPLRSPIDIAKAAASVDILTGNRLLLGVATGDRPIEFPAFGVDYQQRGALFRKSVTTLRRVWSEHFPELDTPAGPMQNLDVLPKPSGGRVPLFVTGRSQQDLGWIARNADGWLSYPCGVTEQGQRIETWRKALADCGEPEKPFAQSLYIDLATDPNQSASGIHLGYRLGRNRLLAHLTALEQIGVRHVMLNLKYGRRPATDVVAELVEHVVPHFPAETAPESSR